MQKGGNILALGKALDAALADFETELAAGRHDRAHRRSAEGRRRAAVFEFSRSFVEALVIVLAVSFLSLGWRAGLVVATSVPLVLAIVFIAMAFLGLDLQRVTLGALIIALGLLVDDAIIATEMMVVKLEQGWDRERAASFAWTSTAFPMLTGTLVTAVGFMPIGLANSAVGEYTGGIFWVVGIALVASWFVAVLFTPYLGFKLLPNYRAGAHRARRERHLRDAVLSRLPPRARILRFAPARHHRRARGAARAWPHPVQPGAAAVLPDVRAARIVLRTEARRRLVDPGDGSRGEGGRSACRRRPRRASPTPRISARARRGSGSASSRSSRTNPSRRSSSSRATSRRASASRRGSRPRSPRARLSAGARAARPLQLRPAGWLSRCSSASSAPTPDAVRETAERVRDVMRADPRVIDPHLNWGEKMPSLRLEVDQARARALGLTPQDIAETLQTLVGGATVTTLRVGEERVDVVARAVPGERAALDRIEDLTIATRDGVAVPRRPGRARHPHDRGPDHLAQGSRDRRHRASPMSSTACSRPMSRRRSGRSSPRSAPRCRPAYRIEMGGAIEESQKGTGSIAALFPIMILDMLTLLMIQMQSFSRLAIVFFTAPLGIVGASLALSLAGAPFGFVALLGLIALAGMDMRNTVILVDQIEADVRERGLTRREAIVFSTMRRARPVALTALAAILAMIPLSRQRLLGSDGLHHHGRPVGRDLPDPVPAAGDLCALVQAIAGAEGCCVRQGRVRAGRAGAWLADAGRVTAIEELAPAFFADGGRFGLRLLGPARAVGPAYGFRRLQGSRIGLVVRERHRNRRTVHDGPVSIRTVIVGHVDGYGRQPF